MKKNYLRLFYFLLLLTFSYSGFAQSASKSSASNEQVEGLSIYPNPVVNGKVYITSKKSITKQIEIFDVLGKKVFKTMLYSRELVLKDLKAGVYIIKVKEGKAETTRKLVIR